jgi:hypothetical protein
MRSKTANKSQTKKPLKSGRAVLYLPPGANLSDLVMDGAQVIQELFITKRTLLNWCCTGKISYTDVLGKIFYFKQEIAQILLQGKQRRKKK